MNVFLGLFLVAFTGLSLEITLVRLLSVVTWYHLAFFAISAAMLGMTAGATRVFLSPRKFRSGNLPKSLWTSSLSLAFSIPVTLVLLCLVPLGVRKDVMGLPSLLITTAACALPFYFAGTILSAVLTKHDLPMGKLYASDLVGASTGCLFVLGGLELFDAPSLILLCGCTSAAAAVCFGWKEPLRRRYPGAFISLLFLLAGIMNTSSALGIRPLVVKGKVDPPAAHLIERWNSFSRIVVKDKTLGPPQYWGPSRCAPQDSVLQYPMDIDGQAGTFMRRFNSKEDIDHLRYDVTNIAYYLDRRGKTLVIGVGGGRDIQSAVLFGQERVVGVEINPIFNDLLRKDFREFAGLVNRPDVTLVTAEARSYLLQSPEKYSVIQMSLIDTWAATGAGAFSLSENSLYTVEAWELILGRLEDEGIFTVSRWHSPDRIGETGRVVSLAVAALLDQGIQVPSEHIALITAGRISTLIVSRGPFSRRDLQTLSRECGELAFSAVLLPGQPSPDPMLQRIASARTRDDLTAATAGAELNYDPPTYESPYFFNMLRLNHMGEALKGDVGVVSGNLMATLTLLRLVATLLVGAIATIVIPLMLRNRFVARSNVRARTLWSGAIYFSLIGAGFMLTEIALIQRLTVLLSHPVYALGILLFTLIASAGIGSLASDRLPLTRAPWAYVYPALAALCLVGLRFLLNGLLVTMISVPTPVKIAAAVLVIFPVGLLMGVFFPAGMRLTKSIAPEETPWYWALNGIFGVLCSALAVFISIYLGISANFYIAAICYGAVLIPQVGLQRAQGKGPAAGARVEKVI